MNSAVARPHALLRWVLVAVSALGLCVSIVDYVSTGNGIDHTYGVLLVIVSSALLLGASLLIAGKWVAHWLAVVLDVLILLGLIGTLAAAYFLEAELLLVLMAVGLVVWLAATLVPAQSQSLRPLAGGSVQ